VRVHFCGVRGSTPAPGVDFARYGGHTSCVALAHGDAQWPALVLDSGTGVREVTPLMEGRPFRGTILYSHLHWDHFTGLPFFSAADRDDAETTLLVPRQGDGESAEALLARAMSPPHFPIAPGELRGSWRFDWADPGSWELEGFSVLTREVPHRGGRTFGHRISDGQSAIAYVPDHCPTMIGEGEDGWGAYHDAVLELAHGVDLLIHDATLVPEELEELAQYGHAAADYAVALAEQAGAARAVLFHHAPGRDDDQLDALAERLPHAIVAAQGSVIEL
jgi:ribonuclease BN (tRNA processing enzyme)